MRLVVATPTNLAVAADDVVHVRAEDASGAFGILPGHADLVAVLAVSVLRWRDREQREHYVALRGGVLTVSGGRRVTVSTREAIADDDLERLEKRVVVDLRRAAEREAAHRVDTSKLHTAAIRQLSRYLRAGQDGRPVGLPFGADEAEGEA